MPVMREMSSMSMHIPAAVMVKGFTVIMSNSYKLDFLLQFQRFMLQAKARIRCLFPSHKRVHALLSAPDSKKEMQYPFEGYLS